MAVRSLMDASPSPAAMNGLVCARPFFAPFSNQRPITAFQNPITVHGAPIRKLTKMIMSATVQPPAPKIRASAQPSNAIEAMFSAATRTRRPVSVREGCNPAGVIAASGVSGTIFSIGALAALSVM